MCVCVRVGCVNARVCLSKPVLMNCSNVTCVGSFSRLFFGVLLSLFSHLLPVKPLTDTLCMIVGVCVHTYVRACVCLCVCVCADLGSSEAPALQEHRPL